MKQTAKFLTGIAILLLALFGSGGIARAQEQGSDQGQQQQVQDPDQQQNEQAAQNAHGAARVSLIQGNVSMQRGDSGDVTAATMNTPLMAGDKISTADKSRAEIQLDFANVLRLADSSEANIATLDRTHVQVQIGDGLAYFSTFKGNEADVEIDTPNVAIHPASAEASFRILVNPGGQTEVAIRNGEAEFTTPEGSTRAKKGQLVIVQGTGSDVQYKITDAPGLDEWDAFNQSRDRSIQGAQSWRHTDRYYTGTQDLDPYGTWTEVPDYGQVWVPSQGPGWAPYSAGSWVWEPYWGWTWVSSEPWGWAPYHYGRWFVYGGGWAWWPGPVYGAGFYRPIWAPAYVSFFGFGGGGFGVGFGFGFGSIGWLPIGPGDFFHPWWGGYGGRFGFADVHDFRGGWGPLRAGDRFSNIHNMWTNDRVRQGLSTVSANGFGRGAVHATPASLDGLRSARGMTGNLPVVPSRASLSASGRFESSNSFADRGGQKFFSKNQPSARAESFSQQASHLQQSIQKDVTFLRSLPVRRPREMSPADSAARRMERMPGRHAANRISRPAGPELRTDRPLARGAMASTTARIQHRIPPERRMQRGRDSSGLVLRIRATVRRRRGIARTGARTARTETASGTTLRRRIRRERDRKVARPVIGSPRTPVIREAIGRRSR